jgi:hypothetical protein
MHKASSPQAVVPTVTGTPGIIFRPMAVPWLAVSLTPDALRAPRDAIRTAGDLERCVAWALMETPVA